MRSIQTTKPNPPKAIASSNCFPGRPHHAKSGQWRQLQINQANVKNWPKIATLA
jgi:hypothetical protein